MATTDNLPAKFVALEPYLDWDLATEPERYADNNANDGPGEEADERLLHRDP